MKRLLWKEVHEQFWFALAALLAPVAVYLGKVYVLGVTGRPTDQGEAVPVYIVFAIWGAWIMHNERENGRLTLANLAARGWQVSVAKALPGLIMAPITGHLAYSVLNFERLDFFLTPAYLGAMMALSFSVAYLLGLALRPAPAALVSAPIIVLATHADRFAASGWGTRAGTVFCWIEVACLMATAMLAMQRRRAISSLARARWPVGFACVVIVGLGMPRSLSSLLGPDHFFDSTAARRPVFSPRTGWIAFEEFPVYTTVHRGKTSHTEVIREIARHSDGTFEAVLKRRIWACRRDGSHRRMIADEGALRTVIWLGNGELLYTQQSLPTEPVRLMAWNPASECSRNVTTVPSSRNLELNWEPLPMVAAEPNANRVVLSTTPTGPFRGYGVEGEGLVDLWMVDAGTGRQTLLAPCMSPGVYWRRGRVYACDLKGIVSISPDGKDRHRESLIPLPDKGEAL